MELRQLAYLIAVAEELNFTRAAVRVRVAQPAISQQIAQLERELGQRLFDRSDRKVRLTAAGEAFLPHARAALKATTVGRDAVRSLQGGLFGRLTIGTIPCPPEWLTTHLGRFLHRHPGVRLALHIGDPEQLAADVAAGNLDAAMISVMAQRLPAGPGGQRLRSVLASRAVGTEPLVLAVAADHSLAGAAETTFEQLHDEDFVTLTPGTGLRSVLEATCAEAGFIPRIRAETNDLNTLTDLVDHGIGVALLPRSAADRTSRPITLVPLPVSELARPHVLIWHRRDRSAPARAFLDLAGAES